MRAITEAAQANIASVNYHFGGKDGLLRAVAAFAMSEVNAERHRRLGTLLARETAPTVEELVEAFVVPGIGLAVRDDGLGPSIAQFVGRVICEPAPEVRWLFATEVAPVEGRYLQALRQALAHRTEVEVEFRYRAMVGLLALHQSGTLRDLLPAERHPAQGPDTEARQLRATIEAMFAS